MANCWAAFFCEMTSGQAFACKFQNHVVEVPELPRTFVWRRTFFSLMEWLITSRRQLSSDSVFEDEAKLICDAKEIPDEELVQAARSIWVEVGYGRPRSSPAFVRADIGRKKSSETPALGSDVKSMSEADFLRLREAELKSLGRPEVIADDADTATQVAGSDVGVVEEALFQEQKRRRNLIQAILDGIVDPKMCSQGVLEDVAEELVSRGKRRREKAAEERRRDKVIFADVQRSKVITKETLTWKCCNGCQVSLSSLPAPVLNLQVASWEADMFVIDDPGTASMLVKCRAMLRGSRLVSSRFLETDGLEGWCVGLKNATLTKRLIFATPGFETKQKVAFALFKDSSSAPGSKWKFSTDLGEFYRRYGTAQRAKKAAEVRIFFFLNFVKSELEFFSLDIFR